MDPRKLGATHALVLSYAIALALRFPASWVRWAHLFAADAPIALVMATV